MREYSGSERNITFKAAGALQSRASQEKRPGFAPQRCLPPSIRQWLRLPPGNDDKGEIYERTGEIKFHAVLCGAITRLVPAVFSEESTALSG